MLVRSQIFEQLGLFDEVLLNTKEHLDFCMNVIQTGGTVYFEPNSIVTYVPAKSLQWTDLHYYMLRWSDAWEVASLARLREKWDLAEDSYFQHKYKIMGWRRKNTILRPLARKLALGMENSWLEKAFVFGLAKGEKVLNSYLTAQYARKHLHPRQTALTSSSLPNLQQTAMSKG